jgi:hypothetical protein
MKTIFVFFILLFLQSCMLTSKMDKIVAKHYSNIQAVNLLDNKNAISFSTDSLPKINGFCKSKYKHFYTIPLVVYIYSREKIVCEINPKYYVNATINELNYLMDSDSTKLKMENKSLELKFKKLPNTITHSFNGNFIGIQYLFGLFSLSFNFEKMYYPEGIMSVDYVIKDKATFSVLKAGTVNEMIFNVSDRKGLLDSRRYFVESFVNSFDRDMRKASYSVAKKIINEL